MIEQGFLAPGALRLSGIFSGHNETYKGNVHTGQPKAVVCHVKLLETKRLANEMLCGELARQLGLNTPNGYLVKVFRDDYPDARWFQNCRDEFALAYGSESQLHRTFHAICAEGQISPTRLREIVFNWPAMMVFDQWIANSGRDLHDALLDDKGQGWLIDHEQSFRGSDWETHDLHDDAYTFNQLAELLGKDLPESEIVSVLYQIEKTVTRIEELDVAAIIDESGITAFIHGAEVSALQHFLEYRKDNLAKIITTRLGL